MRGGSDAPTLSSLVVGLAFVFSRSGGIGLVCLFYLKAPESTPRFQASERACACSHAVAEAAKASVKLSASSAVTPKRLRKAVTGCARLSFVWPVTH